MEAGEPPRQAAEEGGREVALPVLAATLTTAIVFFPVTFLYGVSKYLFSALAAAVVLSLFASYLIALTVVPLFCALFLKPKAKGGAEDGRAARVARSLAPAQRFNAWFNRGFGRLLDGYGVVVRGVLRYPALTLILFAAAFGVVAAQYPRLGVSFFPRTDAGQFVILAKAPSGTRLNVTERLIGRMENTIRQVVGDELDMIVSNIGTAPGFSAIYTSNSAMHTAFVQVNLKDGHRTSSFEHMARLKRRLARDVPELSTFFQPGGMVDAVLNLGLPAPIDIQVSGFQLDQAYAVATRLGREIRKVPDVADVFIPQDIDYPALRLNVDRSRAALLGMEQRQVVQDVITALNSNQMIAPSYWIDPKNGNDYMLTVQYPERQIKSMDDLKAIPLRGASSPEGARLDALTSLTKSYEPTEVDHYQLQRVIDVYVRPEGEDLGRIVNAIDGITQSLQLPADTSVDMRGMVQNMRISFHSFALGLIMSMALLYLVLIAQFRSFADPLVILLAVPPGIAGVILILLATGTTINIMSLMGLIMLAGIAVSNSILMVEFARHLQTEAHMGVREAIAKACTVRLRPVLMTSLATIIGLLPMALKMGTGSEAYAPLARTIIGGLALSVVLTVILVPPAYWFVHRREDVPARPAGEIAG